MPWLKYLAYLSNIIFTQVSKLRFLLRSSQVLAVRRVSSSLAPDLETCVK